MSRLFLRNSEPQTQAWSEVPVIREPVYLSFVVQLTARHFEWLVGREKKAVNESH